MKAFDVVDSRVERRHVAARDAIYLPLTSAAKSRRRQSPTLLEKAVEAYPSLSVYIFVSLSLHSATLCPTLQLHGHQLG